MKKLTNHQKNIQQHFKNIEARVGKNKDPYSFIKEKTNMQKQKNYIESDVQSSELSEDQQNQIEANLRNMNINRNINNQFTTTTVQINHQKSNLGKQRPVAYFQILQLPEGRVNKQKQKLDICSICIQPWKQGQKFKILPCLHKFHMLCAKDWLIKKNLCPLCKSQVFL